MIVTEGMEIKVQLCNAAVCTTTDYISFDICEESAEEREKSIENNLENVFFFFFNKYFSF